MIYPTAETLGKGKYDRYSVTVAVAKAARMVTDEYSKQREEAEKTINSNKDDKSKIIYNFISEELRDDKSIKIAIDRITNGVYEITEPGNDAASEETVAEEAPDAEGADKEA